MPWVIETKGLPVRMFYRLGGVPEEPVSCLTFGLEDALQFARERDANEMIVSLDWDDPELVAAPAEQRRRRTHPSLSQRTEA